MKVPVTSLFTALTCGVVWFGAPSLLTDMVGLGSSKAILGQISVVALVAACLMQPTTRIRSSYYFWIVLFFIYALTLAITYQFLDLGVSIKPLLGAAVKVCLFFCLIGVVVSQPRLLYSPINIAFYPILFGSIIAVAAHNIFQNPEITRLVFDNRQVSLLNGALASSRLYVLDIPIYRISGIFNEPGTYALILYCYFLFLVTNNGPNMRSIFVTVINYLSTFSLGALVSFPFFIFGFFYVFKRRSEFKLRRRVKYPLIIFVCAFVSVLLKPFVAVFERLYFDPSSGTIAGDNRFIDNTAPNNIFFGDGSFGGGFDSIFLVFKQYGILGSGIFLLPYIVTFVLLLISRRKFFALGFILFSLHKPWVLNGTLMLLLSGVCGCIIREMLIEFRQGKGAFGGAALQFYENTSYGNK